MKNEATLDFILLLRENIVGARAKLAENKRQNSIAPETSNS